MSVLMVPEDAKPWPSLGGQICAWIEENLCFGPGDLRGMPARLDDEKRALIWRLYEVYPKKHAQAGRRRFKRAGISLAKGTAKTEFAAWIAAAELHPSAPVRCVGWKGNQPIGGPVTDPFIVLSAYTEEQSDELCYGALKALLEASPIANDFDIGLDRIMRAKGDGKAVSIAGAPNARDGARTTFQVCDETHWWTLERLRRAHQTMLANIPKRRLADAWTLETTTAPEPGSGSIAEATMEYARQVESGRVKDDRLFFFHRQADDRYTVSPKTDTPAEYNLHNDEAVRAAVIEASGPTAEWRDIESIVQLFKDPTTDLSYAARVYGNLLIRSTRKAFDVAKFKSLHRPSPVQSGDAIVLGFDGSQTDDSSGIVATHMETGFQWVPGLWERPYSAKEWRVPAGEVDDTVRALFAEYNVLRMNADPPYWQSWVAQWAGEFGEKIVIEWWTNRRRQMSYALEAFDTAISEGTISHDGNADLARHIGNAHKRYINEKDDEGKALWLIEKERSDSPNKIDLAMCAVLSNQARNDMIAEGALAGEQFVEGSLVII